MELRDQDQLKASRDAYQQALVLWTQLEQSDPTDERYRAEEARTRLGLGNVEQGSRQLEPARGQYERALAVRTGLAAAHPDRADYARDLATTRHNLAMIQAYLGPADRAEDKALLSPFLPSGCG